MSTYWDLACRTCDVKSGAFHWNHGDDRLRGLVPHLATIAACAALRGTDISIVISSGAEWSNWDALIDFAAAHHTHDVRPKSEYGAYDDECGRLFACSCCQTRLSCGKPVGHEGDHGKVD